MYFSCMQCMYANSLLISGFAHGSRTTNANANARGARGISKTPPTPTPTATQPLRLPATLLFHSTARSFVPSHHGLHIRSWHTMSGEGSPLGLLRPEPEIQDIFPIVRHRPASAHRSDRTRGFLPVSSDPTNSLNWGWCASSFYPQLYAPLPLCTCNGMK
jgi:hypothetical protein